MSSDATTPVILAARRTPIGRFLGGLSRVPSPELGAIAIEAALADAGVAANAVEEVFMGCVLQAGVGQNPARHAALKAGIPDTVTAVTVNKVCGSGLESVMQAARAIRRATSRSRSRAACRTWTAPRTSRGCGTA